MPEIKCTVSNCEYWDQGNVCSAAQVLITAGGTQGKDPEGANAALVERTPIGVAQDCFCLTFRARQDLSEEHQEEVEANLVPML